MASQSPMFAIGDRLVCIVEVSPDCFRYMDYLTDELSGGCFDGRRLPLAIAHLARLELQGAAIPATHNVG